VLDILTDTWEKSKLFVCDSLLHTFAASSIFKATWAVAKN
jgi:hypothetical protein